MPPGDLRSNHIAKGNLNTSRFEGGGSGEATDGGSVLSIVFLENKE